MAHEQGSAVLRGAVNEAKELLAAGADPKLPAPGYPPEWNVLFDYRPAPLIHLAVLTGNVEMVRLLLAHGVDINERPSRAARSRCDDRRRGSRGVTPCSAYMRTT